MRGKVRQRRPTPLAELVRQVDAFNAACRPGDKVSVLRDRGTVEVSTTTSEAYVLSGHTMPIRLAPSEGGD